MFRQLLEEAFEELIQQVAPQRPQIGEKVQPRFDQLLDPAEEGRRAPREPFFAEGRRAPREAPEAVRSTLAIAPAQPRSRRVHPLRAQLQSRTSIRNAFRIMEILRPPVSLRDPLDHLQDR